ncbi:MAG: carboxypeptidase regulatory-like domain-containing protein, partial [Candidatus Pacebacteria bacterium]|nr:carboxypeptidase regulatory-like domain-containing protein [Candidatus Paceibacterota bacterium]
KKINLTIFLSLFLFIAPLFVFSADISNSERYALFTEDGSRLNMKPTGYGVDVTSSVLTGYAFAENAGWINFAPTTQGVLNDGTGVLSGYAWGENTGWINFAPTNGGVIILSNGQFDGYAWSQNFGWIQFDCSVVNACVSTSWRPSSGSTSGSGGTSGTTTTPPTNPVDPPTTPPTETVPPENPQPPTAPPVESPEQGEGTTIPTCPDGDCFETEIPSTTPALIPPGTDPAHSSSLSEPIATIVSDTYTVVTETISKIVDVVAGVVLGSFESVADITTDFVQSEKYDEVKDYVFAGSVGTLVLPSFLSFVNSILTPGRFSSLFVSLLGWRRKKKPWGVVYDSITKRPIDPAYVVLLDSQGTEITTSITDLDGRYGFLSGKGVYRIVANKTNYQFPSERLRGKTQDEVYDNVYLGESFEIDSEKTLVFKNIPMDPVGFDWNEFEKKRTVMGQYYARWDKLITILLDIVVVVGFSLAIIAATIEPTIFNITLVALYILIFILKNTIFKWRQFGVVSKNKKPLAYAVVRIESQSGNQIAKKVTDIHGRYFALVRKGVYTVYIDQQRPDGTFENIYKSAPLRVRHGSINKSFLIK